MDAPHLVTLFVVTFLCSSVVFCVDITCSKQINTCSCETSDGKIVDLSTLSTGNAPRFSQQATDGFTYEWDPCREYSCGSTQTVGCQIDLSGGKYIIGVKSSASFIKDGNSIALKYNDGNIPPGRTSTVHLICDPTATSPSYTAQGTQSYMAYEMTLTAKEVCPKEKGGGGGGGGGSSGWSVGDVLLLIFFLAIILYVVIGLLVNIFVRKESGTNAIPNKTFWITLPGLVKDGGQFAFNKTRGLVSKDGTTYQQM